MTRCEASHLGAIPYLVSCLPQRMLHSKVKTFDVFFKKMGEENEKVEKVTNTHIESQQDYNPARRLDLVMQNTS